MDWLERGLPLSTKPAYFIHGPSPCTGNLSRTARRINSANEMPRAAACCFADSYSLLSRLTCVRIMLSPIPSMIIALGECSRIAPESRANRNLARPRPARRSSSRLPTIRELRGGRAFSGPLWDLKAGLLRSLGSPQFARVKSDAGSLGFVHQFL